MASVRVEIGDGSGEIPAAVAMIRLDRPPMNALNTEVQERAARRGRSRSAADDAVRAVVLYGGEKVFAAGADVKEFAEQDHAYMAPRRAAADVVARRAGPAAQAGHRRGDRLRARRRLRARADRRLPGQRRQRQVGPAGDPARHHPGRGRHAAAAAADRAGQGQGPHLHRPLRRRRRGPRDRPGRRRRARRTRSTRPRWRWRRSSPRVPALALRAAKAAIDERPRHRPRHRAAARVAPVRARCSPPRTAPSA